MPRVIYCDVTRCDNCKECVTACEGEHYGFNHIFVQAIGEHYVPLHCRHCEGSPCVESCPTEAITRVSEDTVDIAPMKCIGCQLCAIACPFGSIWFDPYNKIVHKCDLCRERLALGLEPACVAACTPQHALQFGELNEMIAIAKQRDLHTIITRSAGEYGTLVSIPKKSNGKGG